jgi:AcrR family transcriptional regulator
MKSRALAAKGSVSASGVGARERVLAAAYELFSERGTRDVGIDTIVERSGVAKMSLYHHFRSKDDLIDAYLERRERLWTLDWMKSEIYRRESTAVARLLVIFDLLGEWHRAEEFQGCPFVNILLEYRADHPVRRAAIKRLANMREFLEDLAADAGIKDARRFASIWQTLMKGTNVTAFEGNLEAAAQMKALAEVYLKACLPAPPARGARLARSSN